MSRSGRQVTRGSGGSGEPGWSTTSPSERPSRRCAPCRCSSGWPRAGRPPSPARPRPRRPEEQPARRRADADPPGMGAAGTGRPPVDRRAGGASGDGVHRRGSRGRVHGARARSLAGELDETVHLGRLDGTDIVYLAKRESTQQLRCPRRSAAGSPPTRRRSAKPCSPGSPRTSSRPTCPAARAHYRGDDHRHRDAAGAAGGDPSPGWSSDEGENANGIVCVAVALPLASPPEDALSCSVPASRFGPERRRRRRVR